MTARRLSDLLICIGVMTTCLGIGVTYAEDPQIVLNGQWFMTFTGNTLKKFYRCLCNAQTSRCDLDYTGWASPQYYINDVDEEEYDNTPELSETGIYFICDPGALTAQGEEIRCTRTQSNNYCRSAASPCKYYHVNTTYSSCDVSCVTIGWTRYSVEFRHFSSTYSPRQGTCPVSSQPTQKPTASPTAIASSTTVASPTISIVSSEATSSVASGSAGNGGVSEGNGGNNYGVTDPLRKDSGGSDNSAALGAGIACGIVALILIIIGVLFWRRHRRQQSPEGYGLETHSGKKHIPEGNSGNMYDQPQRRPGTSVGYSQGGDYTNPGFFDSTVSEYSGYLVPDNEIYSYIRDEDVTSVSNNTRPDNSTSNGTYYNAAVSVLNPAFDPDARQGDAGDGRINLPSASPAGISSPGNAKATDVTNKKMKKKEKENDEYSRLFPGRSGKGEAVSRSFLANYNNPPTVPNTRDEEYEYDVYDDDDDDNKDKEIEMNANPAGISKGFSLAESAGEPTTQGNATDPDINDAHVNRSKPSANPNIYSMAGTVDHTISNSSRNTDVRDPRVIADAVEDGYTMATVPLSSEGYGYSAPVESADRNPYLELEAHISNPN